MTPYKSAQRRRVRRSYPSAWMEPLRLFFRIILLRDVRGWLCSLARKHPRLIGCALATVFLGVVSTTILVADVGLSFGTSIPVMSGVRLIENAALDGDTSAPGVSLPVTCSAVALIRVADGLWWQIGFALVPTDIDISSTSVTLNWWSTGCNQPQHDPSPANWSDTASGRALAQLGCGQTPDSFKVWVDS